MTELENITQKPLDLVVTWLYMQAQANRSALNGEAMGILARRMIAAEVAPGGPYKNERGVVDEALNRSIAELFRYLGIPLEKLEAYLAALPLGEAAPATRPAHEAPLPPPNDAHKRADAVVGTYAEPLGRETRRMMEKIRRVDHVGEISRLAEWFGESVGGVRGCDYIALGAANILTWTAYSIFDSFLDGDGDRRLLPAANATHRDALTLFRGAAPPPYAALVADTFRVMDEANAWELTHCRFAVRRGTITIGTLPRSGDNSYLARRAAAHVLGPLIVLRHVQTSDDRFDSLHTALYDYLIARQFNDDLHDWVEDFQNGQISPVVAYLLRSAGIKKGTRRIDSCLERMRAVFWNGGLIDLSTVALDAIIRAEDTMVASGMDQDGPFVTNALAPIRRSLERGMLRHQSDKSFYAAFTGQS